VSEKIGIKLRRKHTIKPHITCEYLQSKRFANEGSHPVYNKIIRIVIDKIDNTPALKYFTPIHFVI
jgi:hypothetical protein